jgi:AraC-like DNA-binding protein
MHKRATSACAQLCEAVLRAPGRTQPRWPDWARDIGASERTLARLFRDELGMGYQQWRQQVVLAHALPLLARGAPVGQVAAASGYASDSAFTAMFRAVMGPPAEPAAAGRHPCRFAVKSGLSPRPCLMTRYKIHSKFLFRRSP